MSYLFSKIDNFLISAQFYKITLEMQIENKILQEFHVIYIKKRDTWGWFGKFF